MKKLIVIVLMVLFLVGCGKNSETASQDISGLENQLSSGGMTAGSETPSAAGSETPSAAGSETPSAAGSETPSAAKQITESEAEVFAPQDVSDKTIQSISTYNDYLNMYEMIILDFFSKYEQALKDTILYSEEGFAELKSTYEKSFEQQKDMYGAMGNKKIVGKDTLVKFLIDFRNSLDSYVENLKNALY